MKERWIGIAALVTWLALALAWWQHEPEAPGEPLPEIGLSQDKEAMIKTLLPAIRENNKKLMRLRYRALVLHAQLESHRPLPPGDRRWLKQQGERHRLPAPETLDADWSKRLLHRLDVIPADLALAQGAIESAWGKSRFAREGRNYFGHWCFEPGCGLVPRRRPEGAVHEVRVFESVTESVARYMENLNSHPVYARLRQIRAELREQGEPLSGVAMAGGLRGYSALGDTYVRRVRALIQHNDLERFRRPELYR